MTSSETEVATTPDSAVPGAEAWFSPGRFTALLALLILVTFLEVVSGQGTFFYRDFGVFTYPVAFYQRECFWRWELPLWDPLNNCGIPFLAQWNTATLYPPSLFYLLLPLSWSLGVFMLGHLLLAGVGMYLLARRWTGNQLAASVAGVAFAFSGLSWSMMLWVSNLAAWAWMPWVVLAVEAAWLGGGWRRIGLAGVAGAMQMLAGAPEIIALTWCLLGALWLAAWLRVAAPRRELVKRVLGSGVLVAGLVAVQLLPFLDLLLHSSRNSHFSEMGWAMPRSGPANFLVPLFGCFESGQGVFAQNGQYWTHSYYAGVGIVALALWAGWRARNRRVGLLWGAAVLSVIMAAGKAGGLYPVILAIVPPLGFMRYPIKFVVLALFALPLLAAYGVSAYRAVPAEGSARAGRSLFGIAAILLALIGVVVWAAWEYPVEGQNWPILWHNGVGRAVFLVLIVALVAGLQWARQYRRQVLLGVCLLLVLWLDVYSHAPKISPTVARWVYQPDRIRPSLNWQNQLQPGEARAMPAPMAVMKMRFGSVEKPADDFTGRRLGLYANCNLLDHVPKVDGFFSLYLREANDCTTWLYTATNGLSPLKDFLGVSQISRAASPGDWEARNTFMPLLTAGQEPVFVDDSTAFQRLIREDFEPRKVVCLPPEAKQTVTATRRPEAKVRSFQFSAHRLTADVDASAPTMVVVAQAFYHPWHAYVDGRATRVWRANYAFQAIEVPAGSHQVSLVYEDRTFSIGAVISVWSALVCAMMLRRKKTEPPEN